MEDQKDHIENGNMEMEKNSFTMNTFAVGYCYEVIRIEIESLTTSEKEHIVYTFL